MPILIDGNNGSDVRSVNAGSDLAVVKSILGRIDGFLYRCRNDALSTMLYVSDGIRGVSGYPPGDFINNARRDFASIVHREHIDSVVEAVETALKSATNWELDYRISRPDGSVVWVHEIGAGVFGEHGELKYLEGFIINVDERKRIELELQQTNKNRETTQRLLASVFGVINEPLVVADSAGRLLMANSAVTRRLGWSIFDLMGKPITNILAEADRAQLTELMMSGTAIDQTRQMQCFLIPKGKPHSIGELELTSIRQPDEQIYHVLTLRLRERSAERDWSFELAVRQALNTGQGSSAVVAGKLQLVGLTAIKESVGERWPAIAERAHSLAESTIKRHLRPGDIFRRSSEDGYLVLFSHLSPTEAEFKASAIAAEVAEKLTGHMPELSSPGVTSFASSIPVKIDADATEESIIDAIERRLQEERDRVEREARETLTTGLRSMKASYDSVIDNQGKSTALIVTILPPTLQRAVQSLYSLGHPGYRLEAETFILAGAAERVLAGIGHQVSELILTPVRFETLAQPRSAEVWLKVARALGEAAKRQIVVEICDIPSNVARSQLGDMVSRLSGLFKSSAFQLPSTDSELLAKLPVTAKLITIPYKRIHWSAMGEPTGEFEKLIRTLGQHRRLIVEDVESPAKRQVLASVGVSLFVMSAQRPI